MDKQNKDKHLVVRISTEFKEQYKKYCENNGYTLSKRIIAIMKKDISGKEINK